MVVAAFAVQRTLRTPHNSSANPTRSKRFANVALGSEGQGLNDVLLPAVLIRAKLSGIRHFGNAHAIVAVHDHHFSSRD